MDEYLRLYLGKNRINYKIHSHPPVFTAEQSKSMPEISKIPGTRSKNLFLRDEKGKFYLISLPGDKRLNIKKLKCLLKIKEINFATPEELKRELNSAPGSVSIFGMLYANKNVSLLIDSEVWEAEVTGFHPNINTETLEISQPNLKKFVSLLNCKKAVVEL